MGTLRALVKMSVILKNECYCKDRLPSALSAMSIGPKTTGPVYSLPFEVSARGKEQCLFFIFQFIRQLRE